ncbi:GroES-like protein [Lentinus tigrinus ALCF2SS1-7]|uniref:GroES-like protein n=1 Tax=Lentinus tigrinus ALCF2SS1-6 TaxID=1328759 RepID=A0A5C2RSZ5_9APHY|nr:GroES-like protein [Lentinus tigrinus ALCF2SS1-6]RPD76795.1 GroES-like protein [Lentinus tigrinus ALCF2SS1-7]
MAIPTQHKALVTIAPSTQGELEDVPTPHPAAGQILVKIVVAGIMPADWKIPAWGMWGDSYPMVFGFDGAGFVEEVGPGITEFSQGDRVFFQGWGDEPGHAYHGTFQQYLVVPTYIVSKLPDRIQFEEGVTIFSPMSTVAISLFSHKPGTDSLKMTPPWEDGRGKYAGKSFFVNGGATQVGLFALQWAKIAGFGPIIAVASLHNTGLVKAYGATHVIDRKLSQDKIIEQVKAIAGGLVDLSYETVVEEETITLSAAAVRPGGQLVVVLPGKEPLIQKLTEPKDVQWVIARGLQSTEQNKGALLGLLRKLPELLEEGVIKPTPHEVLEGGLRAVPAGLERLRNNQVSGVRLVIRPHETQ